jgi:hypothetical protein
VGNAKAAWAFLTALLALAVLIGAAAAAKLLSQVGLVEAVPAVPVGLLLAVASLSLARKARWESQRTLVRPSGTALTAAARGVAMVALIVALTAALALAVFAVLSLALD